MPALIPFSYFGGKASKINDIIPLIPKTKTYVEPYAGSLAVFLNKKPAKIEVVSDLNQRIFIFYKMLRDYPSDLLRICELTPYSENEFDFICKAFKEKFDYNGKTKEELLEVGRQVFIGFNLSFSSLNPAKAAGMSISRNEKRPKNKADKLRMKKDLLYLIARRLVNTVILNRKAEDILDFYKELKDIFFYLDPPYPETTKDYEKEYSREDFMNLLKILRGIKGKFLMNFYLKDWMREGFDKSWTLKKKSYFTTVQNKVNEKRDYRAEAFLTNYDL